MFNGPVGSLNILLYGLSITRNIVNNKYKDSIRLAIIGLIVGVLPLIPTLTAVLIAQVAGIRLTEAGAPDIAYGEFLYSMYICFWGIIISVPVGGILIFISFIRAFCTALRKQHENQNTI